MKVINISELPQKESIGTASEVNQRIAKDRKLKKGTPQIEICGDLVQDVLCEVIVESLEQLTLFILKEKDNEGEDNKYDSYIDALRILK